jgi:hypothetical protein
MDEIPVGALVSLTGDGVPKLDGIVFDKPSNTKVTVAVVDPARGPVFRTVHPENLVERTEEGPQDKAIRALMQRTPLPDHGGARGAAGGGRGRQGFTRGADHRHASR